MTNYKIHKPRDYNLVILEIFHERMLINNIMCIIEICMI